MDKGGWARQVYDRGAGQGRGWTRGRAGQGLDKGGGQGERNQVVGKVGWQGVDKGGGGRGWTRGAGLQAGEADFVTSGSCTGGIPGTTSVVSEVML